MYITRKLSRTPLRARTTLTFDPSVTLTLETPQQMFEMAQLHVMENHCANSY